MIAVEEPRATSRPVPSKVEPQHQDRLAVVYVRQSSAQQVAEHRESTALQYSLRDRAIEWGWPPERVLVIDEDQGQSGSSAEGRLGFQRLLAEVSLDHVGLVLGIEMSRLARSCKDWHQLLEVCAVFGTLLADQEGLYDPREHNDRLLLGIKGTLFEAELHVLRQRMHQGRLNKAKRGELFNHPPIGYVRERGGELVLDPDEQVQTVVRSIFDQFDVGGTINALLRYLVQHDVRIPIRAHSGPHRGQLQWRRPNRQTLRNVLHHPIYAGAYTWGRRPIDRRHKVAGRPGTGRKVAQPDECMVFLKDRCPAYIDWKRYEANQRRITDNQARIQCRGAVREGSALLGGLLACGQCGCRMTVQYVKSQTGAARSYPRYICARHSIEYGQPVCQSLAGGVLDQYVARQVLAVLEPASLELSLSAAEHVQQERETLERQWQQRLERAGYEADRARRQYDAVDPENRLVARELERRWEQALLDSRKLKEQYDRFRREQPTGLTREDRDLIRSLSADVPALWNSPKTSSKDRQTIIRHLVQRVVVTVPSDNSQRADVAIHWAGGFNSQHTLTRPVARYQQLDNYAQLMARVIELRDWKRTASQIAEQLNQEGFQPPKRRATFNRGMVQALLSRHSRTAKRSRAAEAHQLAADEWWFADLARHLDVPNPTLYKWLRSGWVNGRQASIAGGRWILWADAEELDRLRCLHRCPRSWHRLPQADKLKRPKPVPRAWENL